MKKGRIFSGILMVAAVLLLVGVLILEVGAIREFSAGYRALYGKELSEEEPSVISYSDRMLAELGFGSSDTAATMDAFLRSSVRNIDTRIMTAGIVYTALFSAMTACFWERRFGQSRRKHITAVIISALSVYLLFLAVVFGTMLAMRLPVYLPTAELLFAVIIGLLSVVGGSCAVAVCLRAFKPKALIGLIALAVIAATYLFGSLVEMQLFSEAAAGGFRYYAEISLEALNPYSSISLPLIMHSAEFNVPTAAFLLYLGKSLLWIALPALKKN